MDMGTFLVSVGIGLSTAAILSLSAVAFTLEYAVSRVANFAHGEFLTIGAYAAYTGQRFFHQNVAAAALIAAAAGLVAGLVLNAGLQGVILVGSFSAHWVRDGGPLGLHV